MKTNCDINIKNKKAYFDYAFIDTYIAGIMLSGTEIKSIRAGKASLVDSFCYIHNGEIWMKNSYIAEYENAGYAHHDERRVRKLLLTKKEIRKIGNDLQVQGNTVIPIRMFINEHGLCKVEIALCKGKKEFDKRESIKEKDMKRELERVQKHF